MSTPEPPFPTDADQHEYLRRIAEALEAIRIILDWYSQKEANR